MALDAVKREHVAFLTFTLRHNRSMALAPLRKLLALAYSELKAGRPGAALRNALGYVGDVKAAEQTWGERNGWHPHVHAPWMFNRKPSAEELKTLIFERWRLVVMNAYHRLRQALDYFIKGRGPRADRERKTCSCAKCARLGDKSLPCDVYRYGSLGTANQRNYALRMFGSRYVQKNVPLSESALWFKRELATLGTPDDFLPDFEHGVCVDLVGASSGDAGRVGRYLAKLGLELTGIAKKTAKDDRFTSWDIAREAATGNERFGELWKEHARSMLGARQLTWSRGLRAHLGLLPERTDEELATDPLSPYETERLLGFISGPLWDAGVRSIGQALLAELLDAYANNSAHAHPLVTPRDGVRIVRVSTSAAMTYWEKWRADAEARERGRCRLPPKPEVAKCKTNTPNATADDTEEPRARPPMERGATSHVGRERT